MRRRWFGWALTLLVVAGAATSFALVPGFRSAAADARDEVISWSTRLRDVADALPDTELEVRSITGESASLLVVVGDRERSAFALVASAPDGPPTLTVLPQDLFLNVPGFGEFRLGDAMGFDGPDLAALAVTNTFGLRIDRVAVVPFGTFESAITGTVTVDLAAPFFVDDGSTVSRQLAAGTHEVEPGVLEELLTVEGTGDAFEWIQRQGAAWRAVLQAVAEEPRVADRLLLDAGGPGAADLLVTVAGSDEALVVTLPVERAEAGDRDALTAVRGRIDSFLIDRLGHLLLRPEGRPRIEILNGNGRIGSTRAVAEILVRNGYHLIRTDNADSFDYEQTLVIAQGQAAEQTARDIAELLGRGLLFLELQAPSGIVDVSIIVGTDVPTGEG